MRNVFEYYDAEPYLEHYGIKGQKWGVRRFQNLDRTWTEEGKIRYGNGIGRRIAKNDNNVYNKSNNKNKIKLSDKQKKYIKAGLAVAGVALASYGGYRLYANASTKRIVDAGKKAIDSYTDKVVTAAAAPAKKLGRSVQEIDADMVRNINPGYNTLHEEAGRRFNCAQTSTCYILNSLFGENFKAKTIAGIDEVSGAKLSGRDMKIFDVLFDGIKTIYCSPESTLVDANKSIPSQSTGILFLRHWTGLGHALNYEKDSLGNLTIIDGQDGTITPLSYFNIKNFKCERILDFSNADINDDALDLFTHFVTK